MYRAGPSRPELHLCYFSRSCCVRMILGVIEEDLIEDGRSPEYIPELALNAAQPLRSNRSTQKESLTSLVHV